ncbi:Hypothetical predicted protein [Pelobates cultripes]|uniref:Uncharacterized protein n=1 Tax=Pelobates cultripes TaxID=61616 RepID=A0AAD1VXN3_PELCU|nr:Hypothetical predicted protein [Pelobates cultripes]
MGSDGKSTLHKPRSLIHLMVPQTYKTEKPGPAAYHQALNIHMGYLQRKPMLSASMGSSSPNQNTTPLQWHVPSPQMGRKRHHTHVSPLHARRPETLPRPPSRIYTPIKFHILIPSIKGLTAKQHDPQQKTDLTDHSDEVRNALHGSITP